MFKPSGSLIVEACFLLLILGLVLTGHTSQFSAGANVKAATRWGADPIAFKWSMRERFGGKKANGFVDYHWESETQKYDDAYVHPTTWTVDFDACNTVPTQSALRWEIDGQPLTHTTCSFAHDFPALRTYIVRLTVTGPGGQTQEAQESITLRDLFIVSIGDSFAAGQGTPERRFEAGHPLRPRWIDKPCHRSSWAGPARAAIIIEKADPHSSVTFVSFACTGAGILDGLLEKQDKGGRKNFRQLDQLFDTAGERTIDALLVSIGGNDVHFAELVAKAILLPHAESNSGAKKLFDEGMATLPERFALMAKRLTAPTNKARIASVFITEYPDLVRDKTKHFCDHTGTIFEGLHGISGAESEWALNTVIIPLNAKIREQATPRGWNYVDGILDKFGGNSPEGVAHGFCADEKPGDKRWVNTSGDSLKYQGDKDGTIHPNSEGYLWYAQRLVEEMRAKGVTAH
jgi:hypothetical protein